MKKLIYYGHFDRSGDCENWIANAFSRAGIQVYRWQRKLGSVSPNWHDFIAIIKKENIDTVLISKAPELTVYNLSELKAATGCKIIWWTFDYMAARGNREWFISLAQLSDMCFMTDGTDEDGFYKKHGVNRIELHQGFDPHIHRPYEDYNNYKEDAEKYTCDVAFLGSMYTSRRKELRRFLQSNYHESFKYWGRDYAVDTEQWGDDFRKAVKHSKIIIGDNFTNDVHGYWSDRVYLTVACGGFFLGSYVNGLENKFKLGVDGEIDAWNDFDDLKNKIDFYLQHDEIRNKVKERGKQLVRNRDSYDDRVKMLLDTLEAKGVA